MCFSLSVCMHGGVVCVCVCVCVCGEEEEGGVEGLRGVIIYR